MTLATTEIVRQGFLDSGIPAQIVDEVIAAFEEAKRRFYRSDLRPAAVEGGRFSEAVFRLLEWATTGTFTPIGRTLPSVDTLIQRLQNAQGSESIRLHIPRTLRVVYDIRNKRDIAHLGDGIDPNQQDATLIVRNMEWVLAELVRLYHNVSAAEAHQVIAQLVAKEIPFVQVFDGFPRILKPLRASEHMLALLYWRGTGGATFLELNTWARAPMRSNLRRTLDSLDRKDLVHLANMVYRLTQLGEKLVEQQHLLEPS